MPEAMPKSLLVIGSGAIGIEFASFYRTLGAEVTVVEVLDRILPVEDEEISAFAHKAFEKQGMKFHHRRHGEGADQGRRQRHGEIEAGGKATRLTADRVISAVGIVGNVEDLGLEGTGVKIDRTHVVDRRASAHRRSRALRHRRRRRPALAGAQGEHEGVHLRRAHRRAEDVHPLDVRQHPRLHLLPAAGRQRRPDRGRGEGAGPRGQGRPLPLHRQRQGDRARASPRAWSRRCSTPRPASCSAPT